MTNGEIVDILARERRVETIAMNIFRRDSLTADLADLCQIVYLSILTYAPDKVTDLWDNGQINFFITRIILNQRNHHYTQFYKATHIFPTETINIDDIKDL